MTHSITHREGDQPVSNPYKFADTQPLSNPQTFDAEIAWLTEAARYFANRPTGGEDRAHWANVYNAENANKLASRLDALSRRPAMEAVAWREALDIIDSAPVLVIDRAVAREMDDNAALEYAAAVLPWAKRAMAFFQALAVIPTQADAEAKSEAALWKAHDEMTPTPDREQALGGWQEAAARLRAAAKKRDAGCLREARHKWKSQRGDEAEYLESERQYATVPEVKLADLLLVLSALPAPPNTASTDEQVGG